MKMVVEVLVEYDYIAKEPDELSIKRGDVICEVVCKKGGWWEGCLGNRRGVFPDNYVKVLDTSDQSVTLRNKSDSHRIRKCRVVFSYRPAHEDELPLNVDDIVNIIGEEEEGWWRGTLYGREGVFPSNFVEEIVVKGKSSKSGSRESLNDLESDLIVKSPVLPPKPERLCQVKYAYSAENEDELTLCEGEIITLVSKDGQDPGWWRGELNGRVGVFPDNFVILLENKNNQQLDQRSSLTGSNSVANKHQSELEHVPVPSLTQPVLPINIKPSHIVHQRKSFDQKPPNLESTAGADNLVKAATPPVLGKKPVVPKKSPSGSGATIGLFAGIKKKLADAVDGAAGSRSNSKESKSSFDDGGAHGENSGFDQVERNSILPDVRATRAKAPRRRPPTAAFKDSTPPSSDVPQLTNGNTVTTETALTSSVVSSSSGGSLDMLPELDNMPQSIGNETLTSAEEEEQPPIAVRPKVKEWEKHRAPWLEEMKASQAKRTSTSPGPEKRPAAKGQSDGYEAPVTAVRTSKDGPPVSPQRASIPPSNNSTLNNISSASVPLHPSNTSTPIAQIPQPSTVTPLPGIDMSRSMPALSGVIKTVEVGDRPMLRSQQQQQQSPKTVNSVVSAAVRTSLPFTIDAKQKADVLPAPSTPPPQTTSMPPTKITPPPKLLLHSPLTIASSVATDGGDHDDTSANGDSVRSSRATGAEAVQSGLITELLDRVDRLEKESQMNKAAIVDLRGKLQVETDLRRLLQTELDKVSRCVIQE